MPGFDFIVSSKCILLCLYSYLLWATISALYALDLYFNVSKSVVMRVGLRWNKPCVAFDLGGSALKFTDSTRYLGISIYVKAGRKFGCSYEHLKCDFVVLLMLCIAEEPSPQVDCLC